MYGMFRSIFVASILLALTVGLVVALGSRGIGNVTAQISVLPTATSTPIPPTATPTPTPIPPTTAPEEAIDALQIDLDDLLSGGNITQKGHE